MTFTLTSQGDAQSVSKSKDFLWVMIRTFFLGVNLSWMSIFVELLWVIMNQLWLALDDRGLLWMICGIFLDDSAIWVNLSWMILDDLFVSFGRKYELL